MWPVRNFQWWIFILLPISFWISIWWIFPDLCLINESFLAREMVLVHSLHKGWFFKVPCSLCDTCYLNLCCRPSSHLICEPPENTLPSEMNLMYLISSLNNGLQCFLPPGNTWKETTQGHFRLWHWKQSLTTCLSWRDPSSLESFLGCFLG